MAVEYLGSNGPDGTVLGTSTTEKIGFFGATPVVQQTLTSAVTSATGVSAIGEAVGEIQTILANLGLTNTAP